MISLSPIAADTTVPLSSHALGLWLLGAAIVLAFALQIYLAVSAVRVDRLVTPAIDVERTSSREFHDATAGMLGAVSSALSASTESSNSVRRDLRQLEAAFSQLRQALDSRDQELELLRKGYEVLVAKRTMGRVVRAAHAIRALRDSNPGVTPLEDAMLVLDDALADAGIEPFEPRPNSDFRSSSEMEDGPLIEPTDNAALDFRLAYVIRPGYLMSQADGSTFVVSKARVAIYRLQESNE